jgi:glyoxylase-like metal-dependent hydrolase (beta-lactamase superfamily II)
MRYALLIAAWCGTATVAGAQAPAPRDLVARAVAAMGGDAALRGIRAVTREYYGVTFALGQEETPASPARVTATVARVTADYAGGRRLLAFENRAVTGQVNRGRRVLVGDIAMVDNNGQLSPSAPGPTRGDQTANRQAPERLLLAALDDPAALSPLAPRTWRGDRMRGVRYAAGADTLNLWFDAANGLLTVMETVGDDAILGDRQTVTWYTRWQPAGGVLFPRQYDVVVNGRLQTHLVFTGVAVNAELPDSLFVIPDSIRARAQPATTPPVPVTVTLVELAPGVWRAEGGTHHSLVVDQGQSLVVVEAPQSAARFNAVLDTLRRRFPGKPVSMVVNTHHHWDHAGGVRAALAAGLPVATHERNADFVRQIGAATKTIAPDSLSRVPRPAFLATVPDSLVLGRGDARVLVYALPTVHCEGMLAAYVPAAQLLFVSDVLSPGPTLAPVGSRELVTFARARGLTVARVAGGHGSVAAWADVERAAAP